MAGNMRFFFDFVSPYAYLGWTQIHALAARHGREVEPVPVVFGAILAANKATAPVDNVRRRAYMMRDLLRLAHGYGVPIAPPPVHPFNPLLALRAASLPLPPATRRALIDGLYAATWGRGEGVTERAVVERIAAEAGVAKETMAELESVENKARLRAQTDEALALGVFGVPTVIVDDQMFFGNDSFPHLERFLGGRGPDLGSLERWKQVWA